LVVDQFYTQVEHQLELNNLSILKILFSNKTSLLTSSEKIAFQCIFLILISLETSLISAEAPHSKRIQAILKANR